MNDDDYAAPPKRTTMDMFDQLEEEFANDLSRVESELEDISSRRHLEGPGYGAPGGLYSNNMAPVVEKSEEFGRSQEMDDSMFWAQEDATLANLNDSFTLSGQDEEDGPPDLAPMKKVKPGPLIHVADMDDSILQDSFADGSFRSTTSNSLRNQPVMGSGDFTQTPSQDSFFHDEQEEAPTPVLATRKMARFSLSASQQQQQHPADHFEEEPTESSALPDLQTMDHHDNNNFDPHASLVHDAMPGWKEDDSEVLPDWNNKNNKNDDADDEDAPPALRAMSPQPRSNLLQQSLVKSSNTSSSTAAQEEQPPELAAFPAHNKEPSMTNPFFQDKEGHDDDSAPLMVDNSPVAMRSSTINTGQDNKYTPTTSQGNKNEARHKWCQRFGILAVCLAIAAAVAVPLLFLVVWKEDDDTPAERIDVPPTFDAIPNLPGYTLDALKANIHSPQFLAYRWILDDPNRNTYDNPKLLQRYALATIYFALRGENWTSADIHWLDYDYNECDWESAGASGIFCGSAGVVLLGINDNNNNNNGNEDGGTNIDSSPTDAEKENSTSTTATPSATNAPAATTDVNNNSTTDANSTTDTATSTTATERSSSNIFHHPKEHDSRYRRRLLRGKEQPTRHQHPKKRQLQQHWQIRALDLSARNLVGRLPPEIALLTALQYVDLNQNTIYGTIPTEISALNTSLANLKLHQNLLTGALPSSLGSLTNLVALELDNNQIIGTIPTQLGNLQKLTTLYLYNNADVSGKLPSEMGAMESLQNLAIMDTNISGPLPTQLGSLSDLEALWLYNNPQLTGPIPEELGNLVADAGGESSGGSLRHAILYNTKLDGVVPPSLCLAEELQFDCGPYLCGCDCDCSNVVLFNNSSNTNTTTAVSEEEEEEGEDTMEEIGVDDAEDDAVETDTSTSTTATTTTDGNGNSTATNSSSPLQMGNGTAVNGTSSPPQ